MTLTCTRRCLFIFVLGLVSRAASAGPTTGETQKQRSVLSCFLFDGVPEFVQYNVPPYTVQGFTTEDETVRGNLTTAHAPFSPRPPAATTQNRLVVHDHHNPEPPTDNFTGLLQRRLRRIPPGRAGRNDYMLVREMFQGLRCGSHQFGMPRLQPSERVFVQRWCGVLLKVQLQRRPKCCAHGLRPVSTVHGQARLVGSDMRTLLGGPRLQMAERPEWYMPRRVSKRG